MRNVTLARETGETKIALTLQPGQNGKISVETGIPFFDHMLTGLAKHGGFDLTCRATGDLGVDCHHTIEDVGIVIGDAVKQAIGDGRGIRRFAHAIIPMDESLAQVALDCGGRGYLVYSGAFGSRTLGNIPTDLFEHFFYSLCMHAASRPISRSPAETITTSARQRSRHSGLRLAMRWQKAGKIVSRARKGRSEPAGVALLRAFFHAPGNRNAPSIFFTI